MKIGFILFTLASGFLSAHASSSVNVVTLQAGQSAVACANGHNGLNEIITKNPIQIEQTDWDGLTYRKYVVHLPYAVGKLTVGSDRSVCVTITKQ